MREDWAQAADRDRLQVPPFLYIPVTARTVELWDDGGEAEIELRETVDGELVLFTFTALDRLIAGCGERQPWLVIPADRLAHIKEATGLAQVVMDVGLPDALRHGAAA
jgi:hypothetical protein